MSDAIRTVSPRVEAFHRNALQKLLFIFIFAFNGVVAAEPLAPAEVKTLLGRIREKRAASPQMQADFQEEKTMKMMNKPISSSGKVWFQSPDKFRRELRGNAPSTTVSNGQVLWIYYPKFESAEKYTLGKRSPLDAGIAAITASLNLQDVEQTYNITASREGNGYVLQLTPKAAAMKRMLQQFTIRMDESLQVQRTEMLQPNGDRIVTTYANETRESIPASTFEYTPPAGTNVTTPLGG
ncbi:MAG TPA: outer membrane lipoprotein carrier protein LolA [Chthoniobacterales bacterium]|nr:outer membrane lipoprotein carrier protein LolA [Chthoniobacterales bacterium]